MNQPPAPTNLLLFTIRLWNDYYLQYFTSLYVVYQSYSFEVWSFFQVALHLATFAGLLISTGRDVVGIGLWLTLQSPLDVVDLRQRAGVELQRGAHGGRPRQSAVSASQGRSLHGTSTARIQITWAQGKPACFSMRFNGLKRKGQFWHSPTPGMWHVKLNFKLQTFKKNKNNHEQAEQKEQETKKKWQKKTLL